ncbi:hypothetical protein HPB51_026264 [Rhipicephalus microplus]|uniref:Uncharacterized protein n=1 Tax=Rhipicephalus microplus TaxID=6941 RepID=A0A9J6D7W9_RHIMP|nr:hypothetical protein HPB51_026264 [Rhipicephalus microplus]
MLQPILLGAIARPGSTLGKQKACLTLESGSVRSRSSRPYNWITRKPSASLASPGLTSPSAGMLGIQMKHLGACSGTDRACDTCAGHYSADDADATFSLLRGPPPGYRSYASRAATSNVTPGRDPQSEGRCTAVDTSGSRMTNVSSRSGNPYSSPAFQDQRLSLPGKGKQASGVCLRLAENDSATTHHFDSLQGVASVG